MDIKFNAVEAEKLIDQMERYCQNMHKEGSQLLDIIETTFEWKDRQSQSFSSNLMEISKCLVSALNNFSEYMEVYQKRVNELRG